MASGLTRARRRGNGSSPPTQIRYPSGMTAPAPAPDYSRNQLIHFLASRLREEPTPSLAALRTEGLVAGFVVRRRDYDDAVRAAKYVTPDAPPPTAADGVTPPAAARPAPDVPVAGGNPPVGWLRKFIKKHPKATFADAKAAAFDAGFTLRSAGGFGRVRQGLGLPSNAGRRSQQRAKKATATTPARLSAAAVANGARAGRQPRAGATDFGGLVEMLHGMRAVVAERDRLRAALVEIDRALRPLLGG